MIFAKNFARNYEKNVILGISEAWSMSHSSEPATQRIILKIVGLTNRISESLPVFVTLWKFVLQ